MDINLLKDKVIKGYEITKEEALELVKEDADKLGKAADEIRKHFVGDAFDLCTIINAKSGKCPENCKFCAQSAHNNTGVKEYPLLDNETIFEKAKKDAAAGCMRFSVVTSGKRLNDEEVDRVCELSKRIIKELKIEVCISGGVLTKENYKKLKDAGVSRIHNNLESSRDYFAKICSTHSFDDKIKAINFAKEAGLEVCSGGIIGMGESFKDRIDMAFELKKLGIKSVPVNVLNPVKGTPLEGSEILKSGEIKKTIAIYRFILPDVFIRLAGGRGLMADKGEDFLKSGANASISGDMLTTAGISIESDIIMIRSLGFDI
ncbi:MAG: biotin synthase BioB [Parasporobacterium sp.]|nr:biotin synthase BioB [Parasporobacterium sp.]